MLKILVLFMGLLFNGYSLLLSVENEGHNNVSDVSEVSIQTETMKKDMHQTEASTAKAKKAGSISSHNSEVKIDNDSKLQSKEIGEDKNSSDGEKQKVEKSVNMQDKEVGMPSEESDKHKIGSKPEAEVIEGIDTVDVEIPAGNWLLKRIWWEKAKDKFNKIRLTVNQIADTPMKFFIQQNEFEKNVLDKFYREIGLEQGELQEVIKSLIDRINQERDKEGSLDFEERDILKNLIDKQKTLEELDKDATAVNEFDIKLDDALTLLLKQISKARSYENQAWEYFDAIAHELSDQKAQELYYKMDSLLKDIRKIWEYIQKDFAPYFDNMIETAEDQIRRIKDTIEELITSGIDLKIEIEELSTPDEKGHSAEQQIQEVKKSQKEEDKRGWFGRFWHWITGSY